MSAALLNSSVPRRQLGRELRRLREQLARVPQTRAARELEWSATKLLRMERGEVPIRQTFRSGCCPSAPGCTPA